MSLLKRSRVAHSLQPRGGVTPASTSYWLNIPMSEGTGTTLNYDGKTSAGAISGTFTIGGTPTWSSNSALTTDATGNFTDLNGVIDMSDIAALNRIKVNGGMIIASAWAYTAGTTTDTYIFSYDRTYNGTGSGWGLKITTAAERFAATSTNRGTNMNANNLEMALTDVGLNNGVMYLWWVGDTLHTEIYSNGSSTPYTNSADYSGVADFDDNDHFLLFGKGNWDYSAQEEAEAGLEAANVFIMSTETQLTAAQRQALSPEFYAERHYMPRGLEGV